MVKKVSDVAAAAVITFKYRADLPNSGGSLPVVLTQGKFHVEQRHPGNDQEENVGNQEGTWGRKHTL